MTLPQRWAAGVSARLNPPVPWVNRHRPDDWKVLRVNTHQTRG